MPIWDFLYELLFVAVNPLITHDLIISHLVYIHLKTNVVPINKDPGSIV